MAGRSRNKFGMTYDVFKLKYSLRRKSQFISAKISVIRVIRVPFLYFYEGKKLTTIMPESHQLKRAVKWISEQLKEDEHKPKMALVNEATIKFDLNPKQSMYLLNFYSQK